jgi:Protein of unknown function (DUF1353)
MSLGRYDGRALVEFLSDGRRVRLSCPLAYIDPGERRWEVPQDAIVDGASIPRMLWTLVGGPFEGKYRDASIIHDWYCDLRLRPWDQVHRMFFDAMITSRVPLGQAKLLYAGVYFGGPRWTKTVVENARLATGHRSLVRKGPSSSGGDNRVGFTTKEPALRRAQTVTTVARYRMTQPDLEWLSNQVTDPALDLVSIERIVDNRLSSRTARKRVV